MVVMGTSYNLSNSLTIPKDKPNNNMARLTYMRSNIRFSPHRGRDSALKHLPPARPTTPGTALGYVFESVPARPTRKSLWFWRCVSPDTARPRAIYAGPNRCQRPSPSLLGWVPCYQDQPCAAHRCGLEWL